MGGPAGETVTPLQEIIWDYYDQARAADRLGSLRDVEAWTHGELRKSTFHNILTGRTIPEKDNLDLIQRALRIPKRDLRRAYDETVLWRRQLLERTTHLDRAGRAALDAYLELLLTTNSAPRE